MQIDILNHQKKFPFHKSLIKERVTLILGRMDLEDAEVSLVFVDDEEIQSLNREWRGIDRPTDVISFPMREGEFGDINEDLLGDIVISLETANREAQEKAGIAQSPDSTAPESMLYNEVTVLMIHGLLHLLGYDHTADEEAEIMESKEMELRAIFGL